VRHFSKRHRRFVAALTAFCVLAIGGTAWAYFTSTGSGTGAADIGTLATPTHVAGSPTGSTVAVSWTGVTKPGIGTFGYYVTRTPSPSGTPANACGSSHTSLLPATPTSCDDASVPDGTYTYTVTAVYNSFSTTSAPSGTVTVQNIPPSATAPMVTAAVNYGTNPTWVSGENVTLTESPSTNGGPAVTSVSYYYCQISAAPCTSSNWISIGTSSSGGSWSVTWTAAHLPTDGTYDVVATATNAVPLTSPTSSATEVGVDTTPPNVSTPQINGES
jgi:hypothetical protein